MPLARTDLISRLERHGFEVVVVSLGIGLKLVVTTAGGRVFGPYLGEADLLGWTPDASAFDAALAERRWTLGGERIWLAPEQCFNFTDPARMLDTYRVDPAMDPGRWQVQAEADAVVLSARMTVPRSDGGPVLDLAIVRRIIPVAAASQTVGPIRVGYRQSITLYTAPDALPVVPWLVRQVPLGGAAWLSAANGGLGQCVFGDPPPEALRPVDGAWKVPFGPRGFFKTSYARQAMGSAGLSYAMAGVTPSWIVYRMALAAASDYPETLPGDPGGPGQAAALFRDEGRFGTYGELELYGYRVRPGQGRLDVDAQLVIGAPGEAAP